MRRPIQTVVGKLDTGTLDCVILPKSFFPRGVRSGKDSPTTDAYCRSLLFEQDVFLPGFRHYDANAIRPVGERPFHNFALSGLLVPSGELLDLPQR